MIIAIPIGSLALYALSSGVSPILQKMGADRVKRRQSLDLTLLFRVMKKKPYLAGTLIEAAGWGFGLVSLRVLPLFLVQSVLAASIIITAITEKFITHHHLTKPVYWAMLAILIGLTFLSAAARTGRATPPTAAFRDGIIYAPIVIALLGVLACHLKKRFSAVILSLLSGASFGATSMVGRVIAYPSPFWHVLAEPMFWALVAYGVIGQYLMTVSLQRSSGTLTNAIMIITGTLAPAIFGLLYFGDVVKDGLTWMVIFGASIVVISALLIIKYDHLRPEELLY